MARRRFERPLGKRPYARLFVIATEGAKTEPQYFSLFNGLSVTVQVDCLKGNNRSSPADVLKRMERRLESECLRKSDEAWLVVDKDQWTDDQLRILRDWAASRRNYGLAISNPKFEYWLLLHFEDGNGVPTSRVCSERLKQHLPNYAKGVMPGQLTRTMIQEAVDRAKRREMHGEAIGSTVYMLVERILTP